VTMTTEKAPLRLAYEEELERGLCADSISPPKLEASRFPVPSWLQGVMTTLLSV
jgi:hypothetical protein